MRKTYRSDALAAMHETASDLHDAGVMDQRTFAAIRQAGADARAADVGRCDPRLARARAGHQAVLARYLNVTTGLISQWERGEKHPAAASPKLLSLIERRGLDAIA